jgi:hypothetical protein
LGVDDFVFGGFVGEEGLVIVVVAVVIDADVLPVLGLEGGAHRPDTVADVIVESGLGQTGEEGAGIDVFGESGRVGWGVGWVVAAAAAAVVVEIYGTCFYFQKVKSQPFLVLGF